MKTKRTPRSRTRSSASVGEVQGLGPALGSGESFFSHFPLVRLLVIANLQPNNINVWVWLTKETSSEIYENCPWKQIKPKIPFLLFFFTISYVSILYIRTIRVTTLLTQSAPHILFPLRLWVKWLFISSFLSWRKLSIVLYKFHYPDSFFCSLTF